MKIYHLDELIKFSPEAHSKNIFFESEKIKAQVVGLEPGQQIPPCRMDHDVIFFIMDGKGKVLVDGKEKALERFSWIFVPKEKETRSLKAEEKMSVLAIQIKG